MLMWMTLVQNLAMLLPYVVILFAISIPFKSALAELVALTWACHLFHDQIVTINTDSRYAFAYAILVKSWTLTQV